MCTDGLSKRGCSHRVRKPDVRGWIKDYRRAAGGEYVGAAILGEPLNDLSERNGEPSSPRAYMWACLA